MSDDEAKPAAPVSSTTRRTRRAGEPGRRSEGRSDRSASGTPVQSRGRWSRLDVIAAVLTALIGIGVVVLALDMKFEADQARWEQRQTCLAWYSLQAEYSVGPWYQKLPTAAADCGGEFGEDGNPLVPGGTRSAVEPGEDRYEPVE